MVFQFQRAESLLAVRMTNKNTMILFLENITKMRLQECDQIRVVKHSCYFNNVLERNARPLSGEVDDTARLRASNSLLPPTALQNNNPSIKFMSVATLELRVGCICETIYVLSYSKHQMLVVPCGSFQTEITEGSPWEQEGISTQKKNKWLVSPSNSLF